MPPSRSVLRAASLLLFFAVVWPAATPLSAAAEEVEICHAPPGKPENRRVISVSDASARAHIQRHGDSVYAALERCGGGVDEDCDGAVDCNDLDCTFDPHTDDEHSDSFHCKVPVCGDGYLDRGEQCDDGNHESSDCCSNRCQFENYGATCGPADSCEAGYCDGAGSCVPEPAFDVSCMLPSQVDLPIAINCCAVSGSEPGLECKQDYCETVTNSVPNPCLLSDGVTTTSCLEFFSTPEQNACWTVLDDERPAVGNPALIDFIDDAPITVDSSLAYVDYGTKTPTIVDIYNRMLELGTDRYPDVPGIDSWVVRLPVVECLNPGDFCSSGSLKKVTGALCFEIREIVLFPDRLIKGRFVCPEREPELFAECELGPLFTY